MFVASEKLEVLVLLSVVHGRSLVEVWNKHPVLHPEGVPCDFFYLQNYKSWRNSRFWKLLMELVAGLAGALWWLTWLPAGKYACVAHAGFILREKGLVPPTPAGCQLSLTRVGYPETKTRTTPIRTWLALQCLFLPVFDLGRHLLISPCVPLLAVLPQLTVFFS